MLFSRAEGCGEASNNLVATRQNFSAGIDLLGRGRYILSFYPYRVKKSNRLR